MGSHCKQIKSLPAHHILSTIFNVWRIYWKIRIISLRISHQILKFLRYQKERVSRSEIQEATISNYFKAIKLFCEMNNILSINWKLISRSIPKGRHASNDRPPSREEIIKLLEYPDRRMYTWNSKTTGWIQDLSPWRSLQAYQGVFSRKE